MLGEPLSMLVPQVVGFRLTGALPEGATATDLVLTVTEILRKTGVVGKFVEYFGPGLAALSLADRATLGNMSPEYGATCGFFPVDDATLEYLRLTGRPRRARRARRGLLQGEHALARRPTTTRPTRRSSSSTSATVEPSLAGPRRPQDRVPLRSAKDAFLARAAELRRRLREREGRGGRRELPRERPARARRAGPRGARPARRSRRRRRRARAGRRARRDRRPRVRARPRLRRDRRDHELHEHLEPAGDGRRRPAREEGGRARPRPEAVGEVEPRARLAGRHRLLREGRPDAVPRGARLPHRRLRLHDLHRELRPAAGGDLRGGRPRTTSSSAPSSPATATSRRASIPR